MNYTKAILDQNISLKKENAKLIHENIELKKQISELEQLRIGSVVSSKTLRSKIANKRERLKGDLDNATNIINGNKGMSSDYIIDKARNMPFLRCKLNLIDELLAD